MIIKEVLEKYFAEKQWDGQGGSDVPSTGRWVILNQQQLWDAEKDLMAIMDTDNDGCIENCQEIAILKKNIEELKALSKPSVPSVEEIEKIIMKVAAYWKIDKQDAGRELLVIPADRKAAAQAIHNLLTGRSQ